jgi:Zn-finger nucleic acid-binding protein
VAVYRDQVLMCPRCAGVALSAAETPRLTRHTCARCSGTWIDDADLRRMFADLDFAEDEAFGPFVTTTGTLPCLRCRVPMAIEHPVGAPQIEIDVCPQHGAWLDRDELATALANLQLERIEYLRDRDLEDVSTEEYLVLRLWRIFRPLEPPPERRRGRG